MANVSEDIKELESLAWRINRRINRRINLPTRCHLANGVSVWPVFWCSATCLPTSH